MNLFLRISKSNKKNNQGAVIIRTFLLSLKMSKHILLLCVSTCHMHIMSECTFCDCLTVISEDWYSNEQLLTSKTNTLNHLVKLDECSFMN